MNSAPFGRIPVQVDPAREGHRLPALPPLRGDVVVLKRGLRWQDREGRA